MNLKIKKNYPDAQLPVRANQSDAGFDLFAHSMRVVGEEITEGIYSRIDFIEYDCGISIEPEDEKYYYTPREIRSFFTFLAPRSSISKYNLVLANGLGIIDASYRGPILARFKYMYSPADLVFFDTAKHPACGISIDETRIYKVGDRVAQLVVNLQPEVYIDRCVSLSETNRGAGGFGSSGGNSAK
jgi:dUTP pyrophosphatase